MKHIDKNNAVNKSIGDGIANEFIANQRTLERDYSYFLLGNTPYKNQLRDALIDEQQGLCCYCMRQFHNNEETTLEHIIPKSSSVSELTDYTSAYQTYFNEVTHLSQFAHSQSTPPYPHTVAYQNLVASCKGILTENSQTSSCCNNKRGNNPIVPIMLYPNAATLVEYFELSGVMRSSNNDSSIDSTISTLGLNDGTLKEIRILWALTVKKGVAINAMANRRELTKVFNTELVSTVPDQYRKYIVNDYYWRLFISYRWFESYYKNKNAA